MSLRSRLIRAAYANPALREAVLPLLREAALPSSRILVPMMGDLAAKVGVTVDDQLGLKMADAFLNALEIAVSHTDFAVEGVGVDKSFSWSARSKEDYEFEMVVGTRPMRQTYYGWDPPEDVVHPGTVVYPQDISWEETVLIPFDGFVASFERLVRPYGVDISRVPLRSMYELFHDNMLVVLPFVRASVDWLLQSKGADADSNLEDALDLEDHLEWGYFIEDRRFSWNWVRKSIGVRRPVVTPAGFEVIVFGSGQVNVNNASGSVDAGRKHSASRARRGVGGLVFYFPIVGLAVETLPTDPPYNQTYQGFILADLPDSPAFKAVEDVVRESKDALMRLRTLDEVQQFVDHRVEQAIGKLPRWKHFTMPS